MTGLIFVLTSLAMLATPLSAREPSGSDHRLKGRIIRSLAVEPGNPTHVLIGQKGGRARFGPVFESLDKTPSWRMQNGNASLLPTITDVQAAAAFSAELLLAGTWRHELYVSRDRGLSFAYHTGFPSVDIRDLQVAGGRIYAATARDGVFVSTDRATSWISLGLNKEFLWSLSVVDDALYASSLKSGIFRGLNGKWGKIFNHDKASAFASASHRRAVAGETRLYIAEHGPWRSTLKGEKFADVLLPDVCPASADFRRQASYGNMGRWSAHLFRAPKSSENALL